MHGLEIQVTLKGKSVQELLAQAQAFIDADAPVALAGATTGKRSKKAAAPKEDETLDTILDEVADETATDEELPGFDDEESGEELEEKPAKKSAKITDKDVNTAAMKHAGKHGRPATKAVLAKFKVKSILELKPEQYAKVVQALKV